MRRAAAVAVLTFLVLPAFAQFSERLEVRVHEIDVVVETRDGKPVLNLGKDDFIVLQDGVAQAITNFSVVNETAGTATASASETPPKQRAQTRKPRKFIFFIDAFEMLEETRKDLLRQSADLVGAMRYGDEAMVITPAWPTRIPLFFTSDKQALMRTLDRVTKQMARAGDVAAGPLMTDNRQATINSIESGPFGGGNNADPALHPAPTASERTLMRGDCGQSIEKCAELRLADLKSLVNAVGELPGKKVLVVMSTHMTSTPGLALTNQGETRGGSGMQALLRQEAVGSFRDLRPQTVEIARLAAANSVSIYGLEAYEPGVLALNGASVEEGRGGDHAIPGVTKPGIEGAQDLLRTLADSTGGKAFAGMPKSGEMFEQISRDLTSYYSLGYRETDSRKKDHAIEVRVRNHPELVVRSRRNVRSMTPEDEQRGLAMAAVLSSTNLNTLGIVLTASPIVRHARYDEIPVHIRVPLSRLTFVDDGNVHRAKFTVLVAAVGEHADFGTSQ
ncbi:MAG: VWA domain-containing protein, partial [Thermoanaerobaculia bacterium]